jgi:hypothetical protein
MTSISSLASRARTSISPGSGSRLGTSLGLWLVAALSLATAACEDKAIGRPCNVQYDGGTQQAVYNGQALECPTRLCLKPARDQGVASVVDTVPYCTAECSKDSECDGETRNTDNGRDKRCNKGFVCGVAFETGPLCCKKICLCKDFLNIASSGFKSPASCDKSRGVSQCENL